MDASLPASSSSRALQRRALSLKRWGSDVRIGIIGCGQVGKALATALTRIGEAVHFGVPDPEAHRAAVAAIGPMHRVGSVASAVAASDLLMLAVPHAAVASIAQSVTDWGDRILVDATNPLAPGLSGLLVGTDDSAAEQLARAARNARVVKAFNSTGAENMANSDYGAARPMMPVCGNDLAARTAVMALANRIGFEPIDFGPLTSARWLEPMALAWIDLAFRRGMGRDFAFGVLRRPI